MRISGSAYWLLPEVDMPTSLIVHGGAWDIPDDEVEEHQAGCRRALEVGWRVLESGGAALDAVEAAVRALEDAPIFDAGVGSVLNRDGEVELDAALMDGATLRSGAVAAVRRVRNPITLARRVLESQVVLLVGRGAERFAEAAGLPFCDMAELIVERERRRWEKLRAQEDFRAQDAFGARQADRRGWAEAGHDQAALNPPSSILKHPSDTVGAVALDRYGHLAAGTSTGGTANKLPGRVGDSPLIGAGLYADDASGGCSSTGWGEAIIKVLLAKTATDLIGAGHDPSEAARRAIDVLERRVGGLGGCILLDAQGQVGFAFNTPRMAYAYRTEAGGEVIGI
jgi:beta-aspartyl-peptidase (threonine type)